MIPRPALLLLPLAALLASAGVAAASNIEWRPTAAAAFEEAKRDGKVVFVAVNMDGERANDEMIRSHYQDATIQKLAALCVPLFASKHDHDSGDRPCPRGGVVTCAQHQQVEKDVRRQYLQLQNDATIAPQHLWIGPDGVLLLSVPYQISIGEMEWCFATALGRVDPEFKWSPSGGARAPRRLVDGGVTATALDTAQPPPTRKEVLALIEEMRKEQRPWDRRGDVLRIMLSDEQEAIDYAKTIVTSRGRGGRFGGGGDGRATQWKAELIHAVGQYSPPEYWEILPTLLIDNEPKIRREAAVALEQLASPKALPELTKAYGKEEDPEVRKELIRAIASCGRAGKATKTVTKTALKSKEDAIRPYAMVGVFYLEDRKEVEETLRAGLLSELPAVRGAAAWVVGARREEALLSTLETALESETDFDVKEAFEAVKAVLGGGEAGPLDAVLRRFANSDIPRDRV